MARELVLLNSNEITSVHDLHLKVSNFQNVNVSLYRPTTRALERYDAKYVYLLARVISMSDSKNYQC